MLMVLVKIAEAISCIIKLPMPEETKEMRNPCLRTTKQKQTKTRCYKLFIFMIHTEKRKTFAISSQDEALLRRNMRDWFIRKVDSQKRWFISSSVFLLGFPLVPILEDLSKCTYKMLLRLDVRF